MQGRRRGALAPLVRVLARRAEALAARVGARLRVVLVLDGEPAVKVRERAVGGASRADARGLCAGEEGERR